MQYKKIRYNWILHQKKTLKSKNNEEPVDEWSFHSKFNVFKCIVIGVMIIQSESWDIQILVAVFSPPTVTHFSPISKAFGIKVRILDKESKKWKYEKNVDCVNNAIAAKAYAATKRLNHFKTSQRRVENSDSFFLNEWSPFQFGATSKVSDQCQLCCVGCLTWDKKPSFRSYGETALFFVRYEPANWKKKICKPYHFVGPKLLFQGIKSHLNEWHSNYL